MIGKQKPGIKVLMVVLGALLILTTFIGCAAEEPKKGTIHYGDGGWDSFQFLNRIAAFITENGYGYQSEFIPAETITLIQGTRRGDMDVYMEASVGQMPEVYAEMMDSGDCVNLGMIFSGTWQGWLVPTYMIENGDLPEGISVSDMPEYWELFKDPEEPTKGRFYSCIPGWMCQEINEAKIKAYGLDEYYNIFVPGSDMALQVSMVAAYEKGEPWFGYYWSPTWVLAKYDMTPLEEPAWTEELWDVESKTWACAYPMNENYTLVHHSLLDRAPEIAELLRNMQLTNDHINEVLLYMQDNDASVEEGAIWFLKEYESVWTKWVPADVAAKVKAALP